MKKIFALFALLATLLTSAQQKPAFWEDIEKFRQENLAHPPAPGTILFLGSSSFTNWKGVNDYFPGKNIINRGFGGSTLLDLNFYSEELLEPYNPRQVVIYCGENDFAADPDVKPRQVFNRFKNFYRDIRKYHPAVEVAYVSIKLSPSREALWPKFATANRLIKNYLLKDKNACFIDITKAMEGADGAVRRDIFLDDMLHMKPEGYRIWADVMRPYLK